MAKKQAKWSGQAFSMRPVDPASTEDNPCVRVQNMVMGSDGALHVRRQISGTGFPSGAVQNHIVFDARKDGDDQNAPPISTMVIKQGASVLRSTGAAFTPLTFPTNDPLPGEPLSGHRGSFAVHNGELYYCDPVCIFAWSGGVNNLVVRRPGVVGMDGVDYNAGSEGANDTPLDHLANTGIGSFGHDVADYGPPFGDADNYPGQEGVTLLGPHDIAIDPRILVLFRTGGERDPEAPAFMGEKTLNTAFALSFYDPVRGIYGRRTNAFALPYVFAGGSLPDPNVPALRQILSNARTQYSKLVKTPSTPAGTDYQVAVWFTRGYLPAANTTSAVSGGWWAAVLWTPAMSKSMNELLFLEGIFPPNLQSGSSLAGTRAVCRKDDTTLYSSGRYMDIYARPYPAKFMVILPNGTAIYFFPRSCPTRLESQTADADPGAINGFPLGFYAEYSVGHPEQIGRNTDKQRDTRSSIGGLRGDPVAALNDGGSNLLFTRHGVYRVGFSGGVSLSEISHGRGLRGLNSLTYGAPGVLWMADGGVAWLRGSQIALLDKQLGFGDWFDGLARVDKEKVVIGTCDSLSQILIFHKNITTSGQPGHTGERALVYDYERKFASEFTGPGVSAVPGGYAAFFSGSAGDGGVLLVNTNHYPSEDATASVVTQVELWVSEDINRPKTAGFLEIKFGPHEGGSVDVTVEAHDHPDTAAEYAETSSRTVEDAISGTSATGTKIRLHNFLGMRGRMFRILINGDSGLEWILQSVKFEYDMDDEDDPRSA